MMRLLLVCAIALVAPAVAHASTRPHCVFHPHHRHHRVYWRCRRRARIARVLQFARPPTLVGMWVKSCQLGQDPTPLMQADGATVIRIFLNDDFTLDGALACAHDALASGMRVQLLVQYSNAAPIATDVAYFQSELAPFRGLPIYAVSVGNEQNLKQGGITQSGPAYAAVWRAVIPTIKAWFPQAIRIGGEVAAGQSALSWLAAALKAGLPSVQALAFHPYAFAGSYTPQQAVGFALAHRLSAWLDEGLRMPGSWGPDFSLSAAAGAAEAAAWMA